MEKREFLVMVASRIGKISSEHFEDLKSSFELPFEVSKSIDNPTKLFHYLDTGSNLCLKTLIHNLRLSCCQEIAEMVEEYIGKIVNIAYTRTKTIEILNILREGLTSQNIEDICFCLMSKKSMCTFDELILEFVKIGKIKCISYDYFNQSLSIISKKESEKILNALKIIQERFSNLEVIMNRRFELMSIANQLTINDVPYIAFLMKVPLSLSTNFKTPSSLFRYLELQGDLDVELLKSSLETINKDRLVNSTSWSKLDSNFQRVNIINEDNFVSSINLVLSQEDIFDLGFLLGSDQIITKIEEYFIKLIEYNKIVEFDVKFLKKLLFSINRTDLARMVLAISYSNDPKYTIDPYIMKKNKNEYFRTIIFKVIKEISEREYEKLILNYEIPQCVFDNLVYRTQICYCVDKKIDYSEEGISKFLELFERKDLINFIT